MSPSRQDGVVRVGAVAADDRLAGEYVPGAVDVLAPGVNVLTTGEGGEIEATGTDFAVPFVAGLAALIRAAEPELSPAAVAQRVMNSADGGVAAIVVNRAVTSGSRRQQRHEQPGG